ncbi:MAG: tetratricopeptide repeat protein [Flavobacteriales bacterium]|nr:tetratricopeptide repeat protein [Flavobacteriales bacterium]
MKTYFALLGIGLCLSSCNLKDKTETSVSSALLNESELFDFDKVTAFTAKVSDDSLQSAKHTFLGAIDAYRNQNSPESAIPLFTKSLQVYPQAKTYYEYGNALLDMKEYPKAISAYHMAEKLDYSPLSKVLYNLACAYSLSENEEQSLKYLELAIQNGYTNGPHIMQDEDMAFARNSSRFKTVYENAMSGAVSPEKALFDLYLNEFPDLQYPYTLTAQNSQKMALTKTIGYDYEKFVPSMRDDRFSRDVGNEFYFVGKFTTPKAFKMVLYCEQGAWMENAPAAFMLQTYTPEGKTIDKLEVAGYPYYDDLLKGFSIAENRNVEIREFETQWKENPDKAGYEDNKIVRFDEKSVRKLRVDDNGKIISSKPMLGMLIR